MNPLGITIIVLVLCWGVAMFIRINKVDKLFNRLLDEEDAWWDAMIANGTLYVGLRRAHSINQYKMVFQFWKPLSSFTKPKLEDYYRDIIECKAGDRWNRRVTDLNKGKEDEQ